jgi:hypothetical protein
MPVKRRPKSRPRKFGRPERPQSRYILSAGRIKSDRLPRLPRSWKPALKTIDEEVSVPSTPLCPPRCSQPSSEGDETELDMEYIDSAGDPGERFTKLKIGPDLCEPFLANATIDEKGRVVRRSPRLGGATMGSLFVPSSDGRTLLRRSARTRQK